MKIALFLGAGASVSIDKPTTKQLKEKLTNYSPSDIQEEIFQSFISHPKFEDIEYILQSIRAIIHFTKSEGGMYFFEHGKNGIFRYNHGTVPFDTFAKNVEDVNITLENKIFENYRWNRNSNDTLLEIYGEIFEFLKINDGGVRVFSTNYDKAIEQFCHLKNDDFICIDGFERDPPHSEFAKWTGNFNSTTDGNRKNIFLYKLHGSLNWKEHIDEGIVKTNEESKSDDDNFIKNIVIYPTLTPKEEEDNEPHKSIILNFKEEMKKIDVCIVIGYSFRDNLNDTFKEFVSRGGQLIVFSPHAITDYRKNVLKMKPNRDQIAEWGKILYDNSGIVILKGKKDTVNLIQKKLEKETVNDIIHDIKRILNPDEHPF